MTQQTIYSFKTEIDHLSIERVRVSKFVDGELESSYLTTHDECDCPAGVRPSCRHRQMLPQAQAAGIVNTHWFWDFDLGRPVDFSGELKSNIDAMNELAIERHPPGDYTAEVGEIKTFDDGTIMMQMKNIQPMGTSPASPSNPLPPPPTNWRRF